MESSLRFAEEIDFNEIRLLETVGKGAFGVVSKGRWRNEYVAVKMIESDSERRAFIVEVRQLSRVDHPNIVKLYGACTKSPVCLVMEYAEGGSLYNVLHNAPKVSYTGGHAMSWALQCAHGVEYLHNMKPKALIHRDLKPPNLLLVNRGVNLKICDFGTACDYQTNMTNSKGSAAWMAPEVFEGNKYSEKCDVFSWGIILWEVLAREKPFDNIGGSAFRIMWAVHSDKRPPLLRGCPKPIENLITSCWAKDPDIRPSMTRVVKIMSLLSTFFSGADQPVILPETCDCQNVDNVKCLCSSGSASFDSSVSEICDIRYQPSVTVVPKPPANRNDNPQVKSDQWSLRVSNTAPASLANSQENLNYVEYNPKVNIRLNIESDQKRRSTDLSHIFEPQPGKAQTHKRTGSYESHILSNSMFAKSAPVKQNAPNFPKSSYRTGSLGSSSDQSRLLSPDTGRGSSLSSSNPLSFSIGSNNTNIYTPSIPETAPPRRLHQFSDMDPQFQPLTPFNNCPESVSIYEEHRKMAQEYSRVEMELSLLDTRKHELCKELADDQASELKAIKYNQEYIDLQSEKDSLTALCEYLTQELETMLAKKNPSSAAAAAQNLDLNSSTLVNDDGWVVV